jgi:lipoprotein-anchoring transpeptidase ErfK/SrfK
MSWHEDEDGAEPGAPGDPTPRGIFHVAWKAGANYISTSFGVPIPYAVFFAPGGIAFHAGSLTSSSHGVSTSPCITRATTMITCRSGPK